MIAPGSPIARLLEAPVRDGTVSWIGLRPQRRAALVVVDRAQLEVSTGLQGDHASSRTGRRQVTLIAAEQLAAIASFLGLADVDPGRVRRNVVLAGINPAVLRASRFRIGAVVLEGTGECHPCSRMEEEFGTGGYNAVRGHGGITARVVSGGTIRIGDRVGVARTRDDEGNGPARGP